VSTFETVKMALFEMSDLKMSPHSIHFVWRWLAVEILLPNFSRSGEKVILP
jgi:hypothetical protein